MSSQNSNANASKHAVNQYKASFNPCEQKPHGHHAPPQDLGSKKTSSHNSVLPQPPQTPIRAPEVILEDSTTTLDEFEIDDASRFDLRPAVVTPVPPVRANKNPSVFPVTNPSINTSLMDTALYSGGVQSCEQNHKWLLLTPTQIYKIQSDPVGSFRIRGGHTGNMIIDRAAVSIHDAQGDLLFSHGSILDRVLVEDQVGGTSVVNFIPTGAGRSELTEQCKVVLPTENSIQIMGVPGEPIIITGSRRCVIQGDGGVLEVRGGASVTATHCLDGVVMTGIGGSVSVGESVNGDVFVTGTAEVEVSADVVGQINLNGDGSVTVKGQVFGDITLNGGGNVRIFGTLHGEEHNHGSGQITVGATKA